MNVVQKIKEFRVQEMDSSHVEKQYILSYNDRNFAINHNTKLLIDIVQDSEGPDELVENFCEVLHRDLSFDELELKLSEKFEAILSDSKKEPQIRPFLFKKEIIDKIRVAKIGRSLKSLFAFKFYYVVLAINFALLTAFLFSTGGEYLTLEKVNLTTLVVVYVAILLSTLFHEFGHASACCYYNLPPGAIGICVYLNLLVFYADVSNVWHLSRGKRIVVNLGGVYFQMLLLIPIYIVYNITRNDLLAYILLSFNLNFILVLNPLFKFDGYWILSDLLGVPNLRKKGIEYLMYCIKRLFGKSGGEKPAFMYYSKSTRYVSIVYSIVSILFIGFVLFFWMPMFTWHFVQNIPHWYQQVLSSISSDEVNWEFVSYLIPQLIFMACIAITYFSIFKMFIAQLIANIKYISSKKIMAAVAMLFVVVPDADAQQQGDSLRLHMEDSTFTLSAVEIKADKIIKKNDGMTIIPQKGQLKLSTDGYDVIYGIMIPGLDVDRRSGSVTRLGQKVAIYINGEKANDAELRNIKPSSIVRIDYIDIPSGKFINDPVSLNIITRTSTSGAYYAFDDTQYIGYMRNTFNATAQWNLEHSKISLFAGNDLSNFGNAGSHEWENYAFPGRSILRSTDILGNRYKNNNQYLQLNVTKSARTYNLGVKVSMVRNEDPFQVISGKVTVDDSGDKSSRILSDGSSSRSFYPEVNAFGNFILGRGQMLSVNVDFSYGNNRYGGDIQEEDYRFLSNVKEDIWQWKNFVSYSKMVKTQKFSLLMTDNYTRSNARYTGSIDLGQRFYSNEGIFQAGYMNNFSKSLILNLQAGSSWLLYRLEGAVKTSKLLPRASVTLRYTPFKSHVFTLNANVGNSFPTLNTFNQVSLGRNPFLQHRGNAEQNITRIYNVGLAYNAFLKNFNYQLMLINNTYMHLAVPRFVVEDNVMVSTYTSDADLHQYLAVFFGTWNITSALALKSELAYIHNDFNGYLDKNKDTWRVRLDVTYTYKNMMLNVYGKMKENRLENTGIEEKDFFRWGINAKYNIGRWLLEVGGNNLFSPRNYLKSTYSDIYYGYTRSTFDKMEQANAYLKVAWRLNVGKKVNPEGNNSSRIYPSSIMK
ncbi:hypothetical protein L6471_11010 [Segatella bryantii]|uniref:hypothetical protein n=1 Tax=Segatella bryantii TaxID=77095 RepID=UPI001EDB8D63|nr:hypothetical protein [Segatella bryantii]UKK75710.1 hypothetical protein L6471_11010 [Segatella bryantii]